jgi:C4-dicarboxylate-specific signal transduction histidine kinase/CheY-like chemotaxis protein
MSLRNAVERDSDAFLDEQRIADQIVALTYEQQLAAYRFLQRSDTVHLNAFRARGQRVYGEIRQYLFHDLSSDARLQVENIKELHQDFEVAAERAFELAELGQTDAARRRLVGLDERAATLDAAVAKFLVARTQQRSAYRQTHDERNQQLRMALLLVAVALLSLVIVLSVVLRRHLLVPLDQLAATAQRLGEGDASARVPPQPFQEFDVVAEGFNRMADSVQLGREAMEAQNEELLQTLDHLQTTQEELVQHEKLSAMGQMLAGLAHELNNPLAGVLGMAEHLRVELAESRDPSVQRMGRELAEPLEREALRAKSLVRNLLNFARKPSGSLESVALAAAVSTAVGLRAHAFAQKAKTLHVIVSPDLYVLADAQKLQHAIVNVVNNALDAIIAGDGTGLTIAASPVGDDEVRVDFDDDGTGIADLVAAFVPFYTTKASGEGTGLGLSLVEQFINEFGGSVAASNHPTRGARITLFLKRWNGPVDDPPTAFPASEPMGAVAVADAPRRRVLVVDDEPAIREVQRRLLGRAGLEVLLASSGVEARELLLREHVDLVISDLRMPGEMDGRALLEWIDRELPELARHALLATGDVAGDASLAFPVPADRLLSKPFDRTEYLQRVLGALDAKV